jgi:inhibitor of KinA
MPDLEHSLSIFPLGDSAITIEMGNCIDEQLNRRAVAMGNWLQERHFEGILDIIIAYSSVSVFYDPARLCSDPAKSCSDAAKLCRTGHPDVRNCDVRISPFGLMKGRLEEAWRQTGSTGDHIDNIPIDNHSLIRIPVCYAEGFGPDLVSLSKSKRISPAEVIELHSSRIYRVYMVGFLPGFPYLARVDQRLEVARKERPVPVVAGSVGIAGCQTGIYSLNSPGGWQVIGRTPLKLFDASAATPVLLKTGDQVQFFPVTRQEFGDLARDR